MHLLTIKSKNQIIPYGGTSTTTRQVKCVLPFWRYGCAETILKDAGKWPFTPPSAYIAHIQHIMLKCNNSGMGIGFYHCIDNNFRQN